jgi:hypothetical protein
MKRAHVKGGILLLAAFPIMFGSGCSEAPKPASTQPAEAKLSAKQLGEQLGKTSDVAERVALLNQIGAMGSQAEGALPELILLLGDANVERIIVALSGALAKVGPAAVPPLIEVAKGNDPKRQKFALFALRTVGPVTPEVVPAIAASLTSPSPEVRRVAAIQLHELGPAASAAVPALVAATRDEDRQSRDSAREALSRIAPDAFGGDPWGAVMGAWKVFLEAYAFEVGDEHERTTPELRASLTKEHRDRIKDAGDIDPRSVTIEGNTAMAKTSPRDKSPLWELVFVKRDGQWLIAKITSGTLVLPTPKQ